MVVRGVGVNPTAQVTVLRTGLPTFFSRIWSSAASTVTATAVAEAYNPSGANSVTVGTQPSIAVKCVKPWLLPNIDPDGAPGATLFSPGDGSITRPGIVTVPGEIGQPIRLNATLPGTNPTTSGNDLSFYPTDFPAPISPSGPQCWDSGGSRYRQDIETCNPEPVACGDKIKLETGPIATSDTIAGVQCLTNASAVGNDQGQDVLDTSVSRIKFRAGTASPLLPNGVNAGDEISTTGSLVTVPVYDSGAGVAPANPVTVIGFLQLFVDQVDGLGRVHTHLINVSGCGTTAGKPIVAGSVSSVPVRLIRNSN